MPQIRTVAVVNPETRLITYTVRIGERIRRGWNIRPSMRSGLKGDYGQAA
jgi:hypothetical protein